MSEPEQTPEKLQTRPERRFEGRRRFYGIFLLGIVLVIAGVVARGLSNPMGGVENIGRSNATPTAMIVRPTVVRPVVVHTPEPTATPLRPPTNMLNVPANNTGSLVCWANKDISLDDKSMILRDAMLRITGWTAAKGGMVELQNIWIPENEVRCNGDPRQYERPFVVIPTRARSAATILETKIVYVPVTVTPNASGGAPVMATATPAVGMWFEQNGCLAVRLEYVREIWINGKGVSNGVYCDVKEIKIVVTK